MRKKLNYIAKICQNHKGKIKNVEKMIHDCAEAGANIVKMQYIFSKNLSFRPEFENGLKIKNKVYAIKRPFKTEHDRLRKLELPNKECEKFVKICEKNEVSSSITCFAREHIPTLKNLGFKIIKVASYDCGSHSMISEISDKFNNIVVSTGASYDEEIQLTAKILKKRKKNFTLLHCVTLYPTPLNELHLSRLKFLKNNSKNIGYSDHTSSLGKYKHLASMYAVYYGAETLERHIRIFDPDKTKDGPVSILPKEIKEVISFSKMSKVDQKEFLKDKFRSKFEVLGRKNRSLTDQEILNRNYYRGRFCSFLKKTKFPVFNWENTPLKNNH